MNTSRAEKTVKVVLIALAIYIVLSVMLGTATGANDPVSWVTVFVFTAVWYGIVGFFAWKALRE